MRKSGVVVAAGLVSCGVWLEVAEATSGPGLTLADAQHEFYNARYDTAAEQSLELRRADPEDLAAYELRQSALLFQLKSALGVSRDKPGALKACLPCPEWMTAFQDDTARGQHLARGRLAGDPHDEAALFFLGKLNLNYLWLHLGPLGRKTGWNEYWEARRSLDALLRANPRHVRGRVARAWIDYIVDTGMPKGTRWLLGGGSRKRALTAMREAAGSQEDFYIRAEAEFSLWDMQVREKNIGEAIEIARKLLRDFPDNRDLAAFLAKETSAGSEN